MSQVAIEQQQFKNNFAVWLSYKKKKKLVYIMKMFPL